MGDNSVNNFSSGISAQYMAFYNEAKLVFKDRIYIDYLRRFCYGTDASCYRYVPQIAIKAHSEDEIITILHLSDKFNLPLTFRAYGSSLSGQACSDSILVIATFNWKQISMQTHSIKLGCGVIGSDANDVLKPFNKKIGPDPATIAMASIGGIVSNNSSGMCCGVKQNSYQTIESIRIILSDGTILDTDSKESIESFLQSHKDLCEKILALREEILKDEELTALIRRKYRIKNTTGYSLNALIDFENIIDIINHLFVGSEGTLGFISSVKLQIVDDEKYKACALLFYKDMEDAAKAIQILAKNDDIISSAEVMDYYSLKSVQHLDGLPSAINDIKQDNACILIQLQNNDEATLQTNVAKIKDELKPINTIFEPLYSTNASEYDVWWKIRKGLLPIAAASRPEGTSVITEDVCFEIERFGEGIKFIQDLFERYNFEGIIFGHALSGNVHFIITPNLNDQRERENFEKLVNDMAKGVASFGGSIKAEHGTGRMVAPFVELEWGKKAYEINCALKMIFDTKGLLNPDVIITDNPNIHAQNIKEMPNVSDFVNKCMECGFCEKACPSGNLTLTPRQRITALREMQRLKDIASAESLALYDEMKKDYDYLGNETCATCSMCATLCPIEIDSAAISLDLRQKHDNKTARYMLEHIKSVISAAKFGLNIANIASDTTRTKISSSYRKCSSKLPHMPLNLPQSNDFFGDSLRKEKNKQAESNDNAKVVYFSTCMNRGFKPSKNIAKSADSRSIQEVFISLCNKAKVEIIYPNGLENLCCGKAFVNYDELQKDNKQKVLSTLLETTMNGKIPVVLDHSACSFHLKKLLNDSNLIVYDMPFFILECLLDKLEIHKTGDNIALYSMCALKKNNLSLLPLAQKCTDGEILIHSGTYCCGFAGNKGFFTPELNHSALSALKDYYKDKSVTRGFGSSSTCEIGLSDSTDFAWQHIAYLVDSVSEVKKGNNE